MEESFHKGTGKATGTMFFWSVDKQERMLQMKDATFCSAAGVLRQFAELFGEGAGHREQLRVLYGFHSMRDI